MGVFRLGWRVQTTQTTPRGQSSSHTRTTRIPSDSVRRRSRIRCAASTDDEYNSWRKKAFGSKPEHLGSTRSPRPEQSHHPIDVEWQALLRGRHSRSETGPPSTSGRPEASNNFGYSVEDSYDAADDTYTPFPGPLGTPGAGADSIAALSHWSSGNRNMAASSELWNRVTQVFVILFGIGKTETEGIYSLRAVTGNEGLPVDTIIAFESSEDAERYAGLLEATMSRHVPKVCPIESKELLDFCADSGFNCRLEPSGSLLMPPEYNVGMTDWERSLRLREGKYDVLDTDPELQFLSDTNGGQNPKDSPQYEGPTLLNQAGAYMPGDNLEELKARLERLLP